MSRTYRLALLSRCVAPITHMQGTAGNESIVARERVATPAGVRGLPCLSGNMIRHRLIREPGARALVEASGLGGKLTLEQLNFLFHGGSLTRGGGVEDFALAADSASASPLIRLVGGALPAQILSGNLEVGRGVLACEENRARLAAILPAGSLPDRPMLPAESFVSGYQYTRGDARKTAASIAQREELAASQPGDSNLMLFAGQAVLPGAAFAHEIHVRHARPVELGCLLDCLARWQEAGGTVGGQSARGHGRLATAIVGAPSGVDLDACRSEYLDTLASKGDDFRAWMDRAFAAPKAAKPAKGKKGKAAEQPGGGEEDAGA